MHFVLCNEVIEFTILLKYCFTIVGAIVLLKIQKEALIIYAEMYIHKIG